MTIRKESHRDSGCGIGGSLRAGPSLDYSDLGSSKGGAQVGTR